MDTRDTANMKHVIANASKNQRPMKSSMALFVKNGTSGSPSLNEISANAGLNTTPRAEMRARNGKTSQARKLVHYTLASQS
jgi:hypothetical protein